MAATNDIFTINKLGHQNNSVTAALGINRHSEIFRGHFPGQPVVPGACMLQIVKDVLESALNKPLLLKKAGHLKFSNMIDPEIIREVQLELTYDLTGNDHTVTAKLFAGDVDFFKFQGSFVREKQ